MRKELTIKEKQEVLMNILNENKGTAFWGVEKAVADPLVKAGIIHKDTWKYTGGCILNSKKPNK